MNNDFQDERHPVHQEIMKSVGTINLTATFTEDIQTLEVYRHNIPGVIAFKCEIRKDNEIIGVGRGTAVINRVNRYIEKSVRAAVNSSLLSATYQACKMIDALHIGASSGPNLNEPDEAKSELASEKQKKYLREIIRSRTSTLSERLAWESKIESFTREEASVAIQNLVNKK